MTAEKTWLEISSHMLADWRFKHPLTSVDAVAAIQAYGDSRAADERTLACHDLSCARAAIQDRALAYARKEAVGLTKADIERAAELIVIKCAAKSSVERITELLCESLGV